MLSRVSLFHKEITEKEKVKDTVLMNAFLAAYWIAKEEIANRKFLSLLNLLKIVSPENMKFFNYSGEETIQSIFLGIGSTLMEKILNNAKKAGCYGLLCDEVTDVSVMELLVTFIQFFNSETERVETNFLFKENILKNSTSANAETIFNILTQKIDEFGLKLQNLSSMASDGAAVMTGARSGLATGLKEVNSQFITIHCLCHKLALACTDTNGDITYIKNTHLWLKQLWKMFENSPKWMAMYVKVQLELKSVHLSDKGKKIVGKKLKKACQTRWLSFHAATSALFDDYLAALQTLGQLKYEDAVACGLLSKLKTAKFIGAIYILNAVLPILSSLSKTFQKEAINFSHIKPSIDYTLDKLSAFPVVGTVSIFDGLAVPNPGSPGFTDYGKKEVVILAKHFYSGSPKERQLIAKWEKFKYDLANLKPTIPEEVKKSHETTSTEWCLTRLMKLQTSYSLVFPALVHIAEVCFSMPVSNAWPERGCSAVKRVKTRLRSRLSVEMLQTLLAITINGPRVGTPECESLMSAAIELWETQKRRRKLPREQAAQQPDKETTSHPAPVATAADAAVQTVQQKPENLEPGQLLDAPSLVAAPSTITDEVTVATTALHLVGDCFFDEGIFSESEDSKEEDLCI